MNIIINKNIYLKLDTRVFLEQIIERLNVKMTQVR